MTVLSGDECKNSPEWGIEKSAARIHHLVFFRSTTWC
jgi:hypothetical protein